MPPNAESSRAARHTHLRSAEYMGEGEVWMFDDLGLGNTSRLLVVAFDDAARVATLVWQHGKLRSQSFVFHQSKNFTSDN